MPVMMPLILLVLGFGDVCVDEAAANKSRASFWLVESAVSESHGNPMMIYDLGADNERESEDNKAEEEITEEKMAVYGKVGTGRVGTKIE